MNKILQENSVDALTLAEWHLCCGMTMKEIADKLKCSVGSVHNLFTEYGILRNVRKYGWKHSDRVKEIISKANKGKIVSEETKKRISRAARERYDSGFHSALWKGGKKHRQDGYIAVWNPNHPFAKDGYVMEHRLLMEQKIGRLLKPEEVVHHINGIRDDNRIENLHLFANSSEHQRYHALHTRKRNERGFI